MKSKKIEVGPGIMEQITNNTIQHSQLDMKEIEDALSKLALEMERGQMFQPKEKVKYSRRSLGI